MASPCVPVRLGSIGGYVAKQQLRACSSVPSSF
jgi:hypothetical protein